MKFIRGIKNIPNLNKGSVLTIGNFDGLHLGHQSIVNRVKEKAQELDLYSSVVFFEPQPKEFFNATQKPPRLTGLHQKYYLFNQLDIDYLFCLRFSNHIAKLSPLDFIEQILIDKFKVKYLIIGDDYRFGHKRAGNYEYLQDYALKTNAFKVERTPSFTIDGTRVSSTAIREALSLDQLDLVAKYLGRNYSITGKVMHGKQIGKTIGFPTANINLNQYISPIKGVYAVKVKVGDKTYKGIANIGTNPTVNGNEPRLETFIFDFNEQIYGERIIVEFISKIRSEKKFSSLDELKKQIEQDQKTALEIFNKA